MIDIKYLRENAEAIQDNCLKRGSKADIKKILELDQDYTRILQEVEKVRAERNVLAQKLQNERNPEAIEKGKGLKVRLSELEQVLEKLLIERDQALLAVPNLSHIEAPVGESDAENVVLKQVGEVVQLQNPKNHMEIAEALDLIDFERAARVTGAKFYFLKNKLAILEQALIRYGIDFLIRENFEFLTTPDLAKEEVLVGKGFLPRGPEKQVYYIEGEDLALVGTAEIPVLGYHMSDVLDADILPKKYVAFSHCFRTEAGSYGRESYGLYRVHQFSKVEMFAFTLPEQSEALHQELLGHEERFWKSLGIPFRVVDCCTGDLGGSDFRRYDLEAWMWGKNDGKGGWGEITSCSNCVDYQARGLNIKYAGKDKDRGFVHTLNGTVVATPRAMIAILENYQQPNGSVRIPDVLIPYCGFDVIK